MDWKYLEEVLPLYGRAAVLTVRIGVAGIFFSILTGLLCAAVRQARIPVLNALAAAYIELSRNTPLLVQLFFLYYGLPKIGIRTNAEACGVAGLAFLGGSYMAETFRSGLEAVAPIQHESAASLGLNGFQSFLYVILPQAFAISFPGITANVVFLLKETSVFSAISLMDLMFTAKDQIGLYYKTTECLFLLVAFYLLILLPVTLLGHLLERRIRGRPLERGGNQPGFHRDQPGGGSTAGHLGQPKRPGGPRSTAGLSGIHPYHAPDGAAVPSVFRNGEGFRMEPVRKGFRDDRLFPVGNGGNDGPGAGSPEQRAGDSV